MKLRIEHSVAPESKLVNPVGNRLVGHQVSDDEANFAALFKSRPNSTLALAEISIGEHDAFSGLTIGVRSGPFDDGHDSRAATTPKGIRIDIFLGLDAALSKGAGVCLGAARARPGIFTERGRAGLMTRALGSDAPQQSAHSRTCFARTLLQLVDMTELSPAHARATYRTTRSDPPQARAGERGVGGKIGLATAGSSASRTALAPEVSGPKNLLGSEFRCDGVCPIGHVVGERYRHQCKVCLVLNARTPESRKAMHREAYKRWKADNGERYRLHRRKWRAENRESIKASKKNWRHRRRTGELGGITPSELTVLRAKIGKRCAICRTGGKTTVDHIVPIAAGGLHVASNIQFLCAPCNSAKRDLPMEVFARERGLLT
jgi:5-methylcytosine-specific restriction endonuclease McrA